MLADTDALQAFNPADIETIFMMPRESYTFLSSKLVKEIASLGGDISAFVPANVERALRKKLKN